VVWDSKGTIHQLPDLGGGGGVRLALAIAGTLLAVAVPLRVRDTRSFGG
jgi:hypothetical protein